MTNVDDLDRQLRDRLVAIGAGLGALIKDPMLAQHAQQAVPAITAMLRHGDEHEVADTIVDLACAGVIPDDPPPSWWRSPLGRIVARSTWRDDSDAVTHTQAALMLGVTRGHIGPWIQRGRLDRHPDGGVTRASVLAQLAEPR